MATNYVAHPTTSRTSVLALLALPSVLTAANFSTWSYYRTVTITPGVAVTAAVTNFPVLVHLNGKIGNGGNANDSLVFANALSTGYDIRFTSDNTTTDSTPFEIERYDPINMYAEFWVLLPAVNATGATTTFTMYYGNPGITGTPSNPGAVWPKGNNGFEAVYHFPQS